MTTSNSNIDCLTEADGHCLLAGELSSEREAAILDHVERCVECGKLLKRLQENHLAIVLQLRGLSSNYHGQMELQHDSETVRQHGRKARSNRDIAPESLIEIAGYQILNELHRGGQGVVYRANQISTKRKVAIKVLLDGALASTAARRRFEREIELAANLKHPNIVVVFDSGLTTDQRRYCVMDLVDGVHLGAYVRDGKLGLREILRLFGQVCGAVSYAHQRGVIHRDLKPSNILVEKDGTPKILDFGLARLDSDSPDSLLSMTGQILGTLPYMSPEQARGHTREVDTRTDVYALGVILYELLTGSYPYPVVGALADVLRNIAEAEPVRPGIRSRSGEPRFVPSTTHRVNHELETVILKALTKHPDRRYSSVDAFADDIRRFLEGRPVLAKRDSALYVLRKLATRHWYATALLMVLGICIVGFGLISLDFYREMKAAVVEQEQDKQESTRRGEQVVELASATRSSIFIGWFLCEWQNGRGERAMQLRHIIPAPTPERLAMSYLLDPAMPDDDLLAGTSEGDRALAYLTISERHMRDGRIQDAVEALKLGATFPANDWIRSAISARLAQLESGENMALGIRKENK